MRQPRLLITLPEDIREKAEACRGKIPLATWIVDVVNSKCDRMLEWKQSKGRPVATRRDVSGRSDMDYSNSQE